MALIIAMTAPLPAAAASASNTIGAIDPNPNAGVEGALRAAFADAPVMIAIARCESRFREFSDDGAPLDGGSGGMIGIFQVNAAVHARAAKSLGMDIDTIAGNIAYAGYLYDQEGTAPWRASASCWDASSLLDHDLVRGDTEPAVALAQQILNQHGFMVADRGQGAPGNESKTFGTLTEAAVEKFQCAQDIVCTGSAETTGFGMLGPKTRAALRALAIA